MRIRTFVLWTALGVALSASVSLLVPARAAKGSGRSERNERVTDGGSATSHFVDGGTLVLDGRLGHASLPRGAGGGTASTFLLATITGVDVPSATRAEGTAVHLAIAVDRSGSMAGSKMTNAISAAVGAIERMHDGDSVTVVAFDTTARVVVSPTAVDSSSRPAIEAAIRGLRAGGDTCISCALDTATSALDLSPGTRDEPGRILLISDGEATTGLRDVEGLRRLAARARDKGFSVSTIGVDLAFDERVMAAIAQESNGRHWFVPDATALAGVFEQEFTSLEGAVANEAELSIEPEPGVTIDDVLDRSFRREGGRLVVPLGAFDAAQEKTVLVRVRMPADADGAQRVAKLSLTYRDVSNHGEVHAEGALALEVRSDGEAQREMDPFVAARVERNRTSRTLTEANDLFERGKVEEARSALARRQHELTRAEPTTVAAATALPAPARGVARPIASDFGEQQSALAQAQSGFSAAGAGGAAGAPPAAPAAKAAVRQNQANASDLSF